MKTTGLALWDRHHLINTETLRFGCWRRQCYWMKSRDKLSWWSLNRHTEVLCKHQQIFLILLANKQKKNLFHFLVAVADASLLEKVFFLGLNGATRLLLSIVQSNCSVRWVAMFAVNNKPKILGLNDAIIIIPDRRNLPPPMQLTLNPIFPCAETVQKYPPFSLIFKKCFDIG